MEFDVEAPGDLTKTERERQAAHVPLWTDDNLQEIQLSSSQRYLLCF